MTHLSAAEASADRIRNAGRKRIQDLLEPASVLEDGRNPVRTGDASGQRCRAIPSSSSRACGTIARNSPMVGQAW